VKLGVVSDTHGHVDPRLIDAFAAVDAILHAGDVGSNAVLDALAEIAPVYAVCGNNDEPLGCLGLPHTLDITLEGVAVRIVHQLPHAGDLAGVRVLVYGHSHRQVNEERDGVLHLNPGAAGRTGFHALQTAALLTLSDGIVQAAPIVLGPRLKTVPARTSRSSRSSYNSIRS
jgi:putative phosphoesterase